jgi:hypothetical protein
MKRVLSFFLLLSLGSLARGQPRPADVLPFSTAVDEAKIRLSLNNFFSVKADRPAAQENGSDVFPLEELICGRIASLSADAPAVKGLLGRGDCRLTDGSHVSFYEFQGNAGETVTVDLTSPDLDPVLFLLGPERKVVATNDDFRGALDSRIVFTLNAAGTWVVGANSFGSDEFGAFRLAVARAPSPEFSASCTPNPTTLCLAASRFQVQVDWTAPANQSGVGMAMPMTADAGSFWFFSPDNAELVIKVLDARAINNFFWVFYGALTNVQYSIRVTDTVSGVTRTYNNPQGQQASLADTAAFTGGDYDGNWSGTTSQGRLISFTVVKNALTTLSFGWDAPACGLTGTENVTFPAPIQLTGNTFTASVRGFADLVFALTLSMSGTFSSSTAASGSARFIVQRVFPSACESTVSTTWSVTRS